MNQYLSAIFSLTKKNAGIAIASLLRANNPFCFVVPFSICLKRNSTIIYI